MCGIVAVIGPAVGRSLDEAALRRALGALAHRGPDGEGLHLDAARGVALGHRRLAVVDLATGQQPMADADGTLELVWNGELYGFEALRTELERRGHRFSTSSDSEVVLALYREHGLGFLEHLRGEFAGVLHDRRAGRVLAFRDRFGIRPLFVGRTPGGLVFASEAKAIFATGLLAPKLHIPDLRDMWRLAWVDSVFEGVGVVPPGAWLAVDTSSGAESTGRYWELDLQLEHVGDQVRPFDEYRDALAACFDEAAALRLRADVPVGVYLSGGLDSTAVAAAARRHGAGPLRTYSLAFPDHGWAAWLGSEHHEVAVDHAALLAEFEDSVWHSELPTRSLGGAGKQLLARRAARDVKVVLTGEGGDEVFLGYDFHAKALRPPNRLERLAARRDGLAPLALAPWRAARRRWEHALFRAEHQAQLAATPRGSRSCVPPDPEPPPPGVDRLRHRTHSALRGRMTGYVLTYFGDRPDMAASLESRVPLLDHRLFELARTIPRHFKLFGSGAGGLVEKHVLREAVRQDIPDEVYRRRKFGYRAPLLPMRPGANPALDALWEHHCAPGAVEAAGVWRPSVLQGLTALRARVADGSRLARRLDRRLLYMLSVQVLHARCVAGPG